MNLYYTIKYTNFQKTVSSKRQITLSHNHILSQTSLGETWILLIKVLNSSYCCCVKHAGIFQTLTYSLQEMSRSNLNFHLWWNSGFIPRFWGALETTLPWYKHTHTQSEVPYKRKRRLCHLDKLVVFLLWDSFKILQTCTVVELKRNTHRISTNSLQKSKQAN